MGAWKKEGIRNRGKKEFEVGARSDCVNVSP